MNPITPAPASALDRSLIGKEILTPDERWLEVFEVNHTSRGTILRLRDPNRTNGWRAWSRGPADIVRYRNKQS